jgi:hypothetical protein
MDEPGHEHTTASPLPHPQRGHLDPAWSAWFDNLTVAQSDDGTTELVGPLAEQAALFGLLARLRDLGATLLLVEYLPCRQGE